MEDRIQEGFAITEFRVLPGASGPVALLSSSTPPLYGLPSIPTCVRGCNCSTTSAFTGNNLIVTPPNDIYDSQSCDDTNEDEDVCSLPTQMSALSMSDPTDSETMYSISFRISGSTWEERFQTALKGCRKLLTTTNSIPVDLVF
jgi:hypothetical protein